MRAIVIDAGIGGLSTGIALGRIGAEVTVYERMPELYEVRSGRGPGSFFPVHFFAHPDQVKYVLQDNYKNYPARPEPVVANALGEAEAGRLGRRVRLPPGP